MGEVVAEFPRIAAMSPVALDKVRQLEERAAAMPQAEIITHHVLHGGVYARSIRIPAGVMITGALVKVATVLIVDGDVLAYIGTDEPLRLTGWQVLPASAGRKQAFVALADTDMTAIFPTRARTVEEAEAEFTDELDILMSRKDPATNAIVITGE
jgi:hypothetical protein